MPNQCMLAELIQKKLNDIQERNPAFSLRAYAKMLGLQPGPLSQILNKKRNVSAKMAEKILDALDVSLTERVKFYSTPMGSETPTVYSHTLDEDQFRLIADWYHYGILSLMHLKGFKNNPKWIAHKFNISENQVQDAMSRMIRLDLIKKESNGALKIIHAKLTTSDQIASESLKKAHLQGLELSKKSLLTDPIEQRDFTFLTVPTNLVQIQRARIFLREAREKACAILMDTTEKSEVYRLSFELIPLTKSGGSS